MKSILFDKIVIKKICDMKNIYKKLKSKLAGIVADHIGAEA